MIFKTRMFAMGWDEIVDCGRALGAWRSIRSSQSALPRFGGGMEM